MLRDRSISLRGRKSVTWYYNRYMVVKSVCGSKIVTW